MAFKIKMGFTGLPPGLQGGSTRLIIQEEMLRGVNESLIATRIAMVKKTPRGSAPHTADAWTIRPAVAEARRISGKVVNPLVAAVVLEKGARRHHPPVGKNPALGTWIRRKLGISDAKDIRRVAFAIGKKFKRRGIPARRIFSTTFRRIEGVIRAVLNQALGRATNRIGG